MNQFLKQIVVICMVALLFSTSVQTPRVAAVGTAPLAVYIVGVGAIELYLSAAELSSYFSTLSTSSYSSLFPKPANPANINPPILKKIEDNIRPNSVDAGKKMKDDLQNLKNGKKIADTIIKYLDNNQAYVTSVSNTYDCVGYYLCRVETKKSNGFEETWLVWAKSPKETVSSMLIGIRDVAVPSVKVTSPNGAESWKVGTTQTISWTASDNVGVRRIDIFFSTNYGLSWNTIATGLRNTGSYKWSIPNAPSSFSLIRIDVYDAAGNKGSDKSDRLFTIRK